MYAIVKTGGKQYTVCPGDVIEVEKLNGDPGTKVELPVLMLSEQGKVISDPNEVAKVKVEAEILEQFKGKKQIVFKFKKRKGYKRKKGHRQMLTRLAITNVNGTIVEPRRPRPASTDEKELSEEEKAEAQAANAEATEAKAAEVAEAIEATKVEKVDEVAEPTESSQDAKTEAVETSKASADEIATTETSETDEDATKPSEDLSNLTVVELKKLAKSRDINIPSGARKADIIELIMNA